MKELDREWNLIEDEDFGDTGHIYGAIIGEDVDSVDDIDMMKLIVCDSLICANQTYDVVKEGCHCIFRLFKNEEDEDSIKDILLENNDLKEIMKN